MHGIIGLLARTGSWVKIDSTTKLYSLNPNINVTLCPTVKPIGYVNIGLSRSQIRTRYKVLNPKHKKKKLIERVAFEKVFDTTLNSGGKLSWGQMKAIYNAIPSPNSERRVERMLNRAQLWGFIRNCPLCNNWFPDFVWKGKRVILEVDGPIHNTPHQKQMDALKDRMLTDNGWKVFRLTVPFKKQRILDIIEIIKPFLA